MNIATLTQSQWYTRPDDEKFESEEAMLAACMERKTRTKFERLSPIDAEFIVEGDDIRLRNNKTGLIVKPTNWMFHQACAQVRAHASYLEELPADLATRCLNHGFGKLALQPKPKQFELGYVNGEANIARSLTGAYYGRIWDATVVAGLIALRDSTEGRFYSPHDWGKVKRALFAGDRDMHCLYIDGGSIVDGGGERDQLNRGFIIGSSEVGRRAWYFATFFFRWCCGNFAIHGLEDVKMTKIVHSMNAPARFATEAPKILADYTNASVKPLELVVKKAKDFMLPKDDSEFSQYFQHRKFTKLEVVKAARLADKEEGDHRTLWQMVNGFTASARDIKHADVAADLQARAGKLLKQLAA